MAEPGAPPLSEAEIGPNAVLQVVHVISERWGHEVADAVLEDAGLHSLPDGSCMIPEGHALALNRAVARCLPREASAIARASGRRTADYIIANRIPAPVRLLLRALPARWAAPLLMGAIRRHAWTFVGAGTLTVEGPCAFTISRERAGDALPPSASLYEWYGAVFSRLYGELVAPDCQCISGAESAEEAGHSRSYRIVRARAHAPNVARGDPFAAAVVKRQPGRAAL